VGDSKRSAPVKISMRKHCQKNVGAGRAGSAKAGVEGANRKFATGTPNPPCSITQ